MVLPDTARERIVMRPFTVIVLAGLLGAPRVMGAEGPAACLRASGEAGARCLERYVAIVEQCRTHADAACEAEARAPGGPLGGVLDGAAELSLRRCTAGTAAPLGYLDLGDLSRQIPRACGEFAEDLLGIAFADDPGTLDTQGRRCQRVVAREVDEVRDEVVRAFGEQCFVRDFAGGRCDRKRRDRDVARARARARKVIARRCGAGFDALGLIPPAAGSTVEERVDSLLSLVVNRGRHFAQRVYPPNNLGPTAEFGPFPVGVRTLDLTDVSRTNVQGTGPRPVRVEVYYPSTPTAVEGVPRDIASLLGIEILPTPSFRDVARAPGRFPLVVFSHGFNGIRFQSFFLMAHLASHGFVVVSPDHHGNTVLDELLGVEDPHTAVNRAADVSFLLDHVLARNVQLGDFFEGAIDPGRIGMSGHSFGGYEAFILTGGPVPGLGTFTDPRIRAILPLAPRTHSRADAVTLPDEYFATVSVPVLIIGSSLDMTDPFPQDQQRPFDHLPGGAAVVGLAKLIDGGHNTFTDLCELQPALLGIVGGAEEGCEPRHLAWRHAHDIVNYLALNFFDGVLRGDADALGRIEPGVVARIEDLAYQRK